MISSQKRQSFVGYLFILPALVLVVTFFIVPLFSGLMLSFQKWSLLGANQWIGVANYQATLADDIWRQAAWNTVQYTIMVTPPIFLLALVLALLVDRKTWGVATFRTIYFMPAVISAVAASLMWRWMYNYNYGVINYALLQTNIIAEPISWFSNRTTALVAVVIMIVWKTVGVPMVILLAGLQGIPLELYEAAKVDGANYGHILRKITFPLLQPYFALALILSLIGSVLAFDQFHVMTGGGPARSTETAVMWIYRVAFSFFDMGRAASMSFMVLLVLIVLTCIQLKLLQTDS